jgi:septal ring factor EnvC (AmiA/AmiB activator)
MPPPQEERWQQQLSRVNEQLQERDSELRKATIDRTSAETELKRVKQQLSETTTQVIQAQQQAQLPQAQIEQQVPAMHARCYSVVMHH